MEKKEKYAMVIDGGEKCGTNGFGGERHIISIGEGKKGRSTLGNQEKNTKWNEFEKKKKTSRVLRVGEGGGGGGGGG